MWPNMVRDSYHCVEPHGVQSIAEFPTCVPEQGITTRSMFNSNIQNFALLTPLPAGNKLVKVHVVFFENFQKYRHSTYGLPGCACFPDFLQNFSDRQILWSLCLIVFLVFTLRLPIQTSLSVASTFPVCFCIQQKIVKNSGKQAHPCSIPTHPHFTWNPWSVTEKDFVFTFTFALCESSKKSKLLAKFFLLKVQIVFILKSFSFWTCQSLVHLQYKEGTKNFSFWQRVQVERMCSKCRGTKDKIHNIRKVQQK